MFKLLRYWLSFRVVLSGAIFALVVFAAIIFLLWSAKIKSIVQGQATAILNVIQASTATLPAPIPSATPTLTPTSASSEIPLPVGIIQIGDYVQVAGTGGDGLRLHASANVSSKVNYIALESEVFLVKRGPVIADGYTWWYLEDPYTENAVGWGVANYLSAVQNP